MRSFAFKLIMGVAAAASLLWLVSYTLAVSPYAMDSLRDGDFSFSHVSEHQDLSRR